MSHNIYLLLFRLILCMILSPFHSILTGRKAADKPVCERLTVSGQESKEKQNALIRKIQQDVKLRASPELSNKAMAIQRHAQDDIGTR